jgi:hypothetical protein
VAFYTFISTEFSESRIYSSKIDHFIFAMASRL